MHQGNYILKTIFLLIKGVFMVMDAFLSYLFNQLNRYEDAELAEQQREDLLISTVKETLLGCCVDWTTRNEFTVMDEMDAKLKRYADTLNVVAVKFRATDMLSSILFECICEYARKMTKIADTPKDVTPECYESYEKATGKLFADMHDLFENFIELYRAS
jgi:hypothetical protein